MPWPCFAFISVFCLLGGCAALPPPEAAPPAPTPPAVRLGELAPAPTPTPDEAPAPVPSGAHADQLALIGMITLPRTVAGLANAKDGVVVGSPVEVLDVMTGRRLGLGNSFYDGSYTARVPAAAAHRPALLRVELVDAATRKPVCPLYAPVVLDNAEAQQTQDVGVGTTAYVALLYAMAARKAGLPDSDWTTLTPGVASRPLAEMVLGSTPNARWTFATFTESGSTLGKPTSGQELRTAIDTLIDQLVATARPAS